MLNSKFAKLKDFHLALFARIKRDPPVYICLRCSVYPDDPGLGLLHGLVLDGVGQEEIPGVALHLLSVLLPVCHRRPACQGQQTLCNTTEDLGVSLTQQQFLFFVTGDTQDFGRLGSE